MKPVRQDKVTLQLIPVVGSALTVDDVLETLKREGLGFVTTASCRNKLSLRWEASTYKIKAEIDTDKGAPNIVKCVHLSASVDQPDLIAAASALNQAKCRLSHNHGLNIQGDEPSYLCDSCSKPDGCGYCDRLILRLQKRRAATEASRQALAWINAYPDRRDEFIASLPEIEG